MPRRGRKMPCGRKWMNKPDGPDKRMQTAEKRKGSEISPTPCKIKVFRIIRSICLISLQMPCRVLPRL